MTEHTHLPTPHAPSSLSVPAPKTHTRRIAWVVGSSFVLLGIFLIGVSAVSWFGLQRFQTSLTIITEDTLPHVLSTASGASHLSRLLVTAERLVYVETEAERRLVFRDMQKQLAQMDAMFTGQETARANLPQLAILREHLDRLDTLVADKLLAKRTLNARLEEMDAVILRLARLQNQSADVDMLGHAALRDLTVRLLTLLLSTRDKVTTQETLNPLQMERTLKNDFTATHSLLQRYVPDEASALQQAVGQSERLLLGENGLVPNLYGLMRIRSEIKSVHSVTRGMMADLTASQVTLFNELLNTSSTSAATTALELKLFTHFFLGITLLALLLALGVYVYFRRAFIIRLEKLNATVLNGVKGEWSDLDTSGSDEIATIAQSVNHFAHELNVSMRMAEASNKAKSSFLANMSHEIRTPMNAIIGFTRMASETELTSTQRGYIAKIENAARLLLNIINDILDFSKIEAGKLDVERTPFDLRSVVENVAAACESKAREKNLDFRVNVDSRLPVMLLGDSLRIFQVLNNLCDNAVKFTGTGTVTLSILMESESDTDVKVLFSVEDQGIGMTEEEVGRLFQPFTQADVSTTRRFGGTGLGLTICRLLCGLMGGSIGVRSTFGEGSTFFCRLPLGKSDQQPVDAPAQSGATPLNLRGRRLLLVEDNIINQEIILDLLEKTEADIDVADNGADALSRVSERVYDLILMDIQMPVMDGLTATRRIRALNNAKAAIPIIAMTAHAMTEDRLMCLDAGMNDHVTKPVDPATLYAVLGKWSH